MMNTELIQEVENLLKNDNWLDRYSGEIYDTYNKVFKTNIRPESCLVCLVECVHALEEW